MSGHNYTLWRSDILSPSWTNTGLAAIAGNGTAKSFTISAPVAGVGRRLFRIQAAP